MVAVDESVGNQSIRQAGVVDKAIARALECFDLVVARLLFGIRWIELVPFLVHRGRAEEGQVVLDMHIEHRTSDIAFGPIARLDGFEGGFQLAADILEGARHVGAQFFELRIVAGLLDAGQGRIEIVQIGCDIGVARVHDAALAVGDAAQRAFQLFAGVDRAGAEQTALFAEGLGAIQRTAAVSIDLAPEQFFARLQIGDSVLAVGPTG